MATLPVSDDFESYPVGGLVLGGWTQNDPANYPWTVWAPYDAHPTQYAESANDKRSVLYVDSQLADGSAGFLACSKYGTTNIIARLALAPSIYYVGACYRMECTRSGIRIYRSSTTDSNTQLGYVAPGEFNPHVWEFDCVGTTLTANKDGAAVLSVTHAEYVTGLWGFGASIGGNYARIDDAYVMSSAPAPSGPAHRVIGSGIINSSSIVRGVK